MLPASLGLTTPAVDAAEAELLEVDSKLGGEDVAEHVRADSIACALCVRVRATRQRQQAVDQRTGKTIRILMPLRRAAAVNRNGRWRSPKKNMTGGGACTRTHAAWSSGESPG